MLELLSKLCKKKMIMDDAIALIKCLNVKKARQEKFSEEVGLSSWDEAIATLPQFIEHIEFI